jgi:tetratricopeptide (TPR) repeat protein
VWTAISVGDDETAADAATGLVWLAGQFHRSLPEAQRWAELASVSATRIGDPTQLALIDNALGSAQLHAARYDEALASFERALARIRDEPGAISQAAVLHHNIAKAWFDRGDLARARAALEPAIVSLAATLGESHPRVVAMRGTLAQILGAGGDHAGAVALFQAEVEALRLAMGEDAIALAHARTNLGVSLGRLGRLEEAIEVTQQALAAFERAGDEGGATTCLGNIAGDLLELGIHDAAAARFELALTRLERMYPDGHADLVYPLVGLGRVRLAQQRFDDALAAFTRAEAQVADAPGELGHVRGLALEGRAQALTALGRDDEAVGVAEELVRITRASGDSGPDELPLSLLQLAQVLVRLGRFDDARSAADEAATLAGQRGLGELEQAAQRERLQAEAGSAGGHSGR